MCANPSFKDYARLLGKLLKKKVRLVLLVPYWPKQWWFEPLRAMAERTVFMGRDQALYQKTGEGVHMPAASWDTMLPPIDTHNRPMRALLLDNGSRELSRAERENTMELDEVGGVVLLSWRTALEALLFSGEVGETVTLVKGKWKQIVFRLQVKGKDRQPFWVRALVGTGAQSSLVKPSKRPLGLVTANGEVLGGGDKGVELMIHFQQRMQK